MFVITTTHTATASGAGRIVAKGHGKQRTVAVDLSKSEDANTGAAVGTLLNALADERQQAMLRHPSGGQRVTVETVSDGGGKRRWNVNV